MQNELSSLDKRPLRRIAIYTLAVIGIWTIYCFLIVASAFFAVPSVRAVARVTIVLIPALLFYWGERGERPFLDYFLLRDNWLRGVLIGGGFAILYFSVDWFLNFEARMSAFHIPTGFAIWFNFIVGSPFAEELFFRGVLLQELRKLLGAAWATIISAIAFTLLHLPQWLILDNLAAAETVSLSMSIFSYGIIFALLMITTKSLWGALLPHWINNFILLAIE